MPAYMIVLADITDREAFMTGYAPAAAALVKKFGGHYVLLGRGAALLEGSVPDGQSVVISEWPDRESALKFWNSPEYAAAKKLRAGIANCQVVLVEGPPLGGGPIL
jgi:uncharacterized protein (DUF1330 family)